MRLLNKPICIALVALVGLAGCSDDNDYQPGQPVAADNWGVYFSGDNESEYVREAEDEPVIDIKIMRANTQGELTVPIYLSQVVGELTVPKSVTFADGEAEQTIRITYAGFPEVKPSAVLSVPLPYVNPYKRKNGFYQQRIEVMKTEIIVDSIRLVKPLNSDYTEFEETMFTQCDSKIKWYVGRNRFIYTNFLGSGIDLQFKLDLEGDEDGGNFDPNDIKKCKGGIIPLTNHMEDGEYGWYLSTDKKATDDSPCAQWTLPWGGGVTDYIYFYNYYNGYSYNYILFDWGNDSNEGYIMMEAVVIDDVENYQFYSTITLSEAFK